MSRRALLVVAAAAFAAAFGAGLCRIADLDFWWHLETGEQIVRTGSIPDEDLFSYTARGREYIDHEWLFQVLQYAIFALAGPVGIAIAKSLVVAITMTIVGWYALRRGTGVIAAMGFIFLAVAGGINRIIERPEIFSVLFAVLTYVLLDEYVRSGNRRLLVPIPLIAAVWANVHAAVIVGIVIQCAFAAAMVLENRPRLVPVTVTTLASVVTSLVNPFGVRVLTVPFELTRIIESGLLDNREWRAPTFAGTPVFFLTFVMAAVLLVFAARERRWRSIFVALFFGYISLRYVRNVGLFCTFVPLLTAPDMAVLKRPAKGVLLAFGAIALVIMLTWRYPFQRGFGIASYFPDGIAGYVEKNDLRGAMMNSYGFGGYLAWALYPERLIFVDGRNEVFLPLLEKLAAAKADSRKWNALLREYDIQYALFEYVDDLDRVTTVGRDGRVTTSLAPVTATRFPRSRWALVYFDDDGMIFVRRDGANAHVLGNEYEAVYPEGRGYQRFMVESGQVSRERAVAELRRKLAEDPDSRRARHLLSSIDQKR